MARLKIDTTYLYAARYLDGDSSKRFLLAIIDIVEGAPPNTEGIEAVFAPVAAAIMAEKEKEKDISKIRREAAKSKKTDQPKANVEPEKVDLGVYAEELEKWFSYRKERRLPAYKPTALKTLLKKIESACNGNTAILREAIEECISLNYQGLFFKNNKQKEKDKLTKQIPTNYADF